MMKNALRKQMRQSLRSLTSEDKQKFSDLLVRQFLNSTQYQNCTHVCCYVPMLKEEVNTLPIINHALLASDDKRVFVPVMESDNIQMLRVTSQQDFATFTENSYGILEPTVDSIPQRANLINDLNGDAKVVVVVPGLAFDRNGGRLGRGKGYYDRFIQSLRISKAGSIHLIALCFDCQIIDQVPMSNHDERVDMVVGPQAAE